MKSLFDTVSSKCTQTVTKSYSTSFSLAVRLLCPSIRQAIYNIYGFVRFADEIVDSFHDYEKEYLFDKFENDFYESLEHRISLNPILNAFQDTVHRYNIDIELVKAFLYSMRLDLTKKNYTSVEEYNKYIYGSADVVVLMCLYVFVNGDQQKYESLKEPAMRLGSAFQKVNFLRDLKNDIQDLNRSYFPDVDFTNLDQAAKEKIILEIEEDFRIAYQGIVKLPKEARFGVYTAYVFYSRLLAKLKKTNARKLMNARIRIPNSVKIMLLIRSFVTDRLGLI